MKNSTRLLCLLFCICISSIAGAQLYGPAGINDHIKLWLDASNVNNTTPATNPANGTPVPAWRDVSGNHNDAAWISAQPFISTAQINGKDVIHFTRTSPFSGGGYNVPSLDIRSSVYPAITVFTVYKQGPTVNSDNEVQGIWGNDDGNWDRFFLSRMGSIAGGVSVGAPVNYVPISNSGAAGEIRLLTAVYDHGAPGGSDVYFNAQPAGFVTENTDPLQAQPGLRIGFDGDDNYFNGDIAEMVVYDRKLSLCEIREINRYFSLKYGIDLSSVDITPGPQVSFCRESTPSVTLTASSSLPNVTYEWTKDGVPIPGATGTTYNATQTGSYSVNASSGGCIDIAEPTLVTAYDNAHTTQNREICQGTTFVLPDNINVTTAGTYTSILHTVHGCDSIITTHLTVNPVYTRTESHYVCSGSVYTLPDGITVSNAGTYMSLLHTIHGCDSMIITNLTVEPVYNRTESHAICQGSSYTLPDGIQVTSAGTYTSLLHTIHGCDSTIITQLTVNPVYHRTESHAICQGNSFTLPDGIQVTAAGTYTTLLHSVHGCDSTIVTNLTVNPVYHRTESQSICQGNSYTLPNGIQVNSPGSYTSLLHTMQGCDSTIVTNLTVNPVYTRTESHAICQGNSYTLPNGIPVNTPGTYTSLLHTMQGCDSTIITNLTVNPVYNRSESHVICPGTLYTLPDGIQVSAAGTYTSLLRTMQGCDSIIHTNLTLHPMPAGSLQQQGTINTCPGNPVTLQVINTNGISFQWFENGQPIAGASALSYSTARAGTYTVQVQTAEGCKRILPERAVVNLLNPGATSIYIKSDKTCVNTAINFSAAVIPASAYFSFTWDFGDGSSSQTGTSAVHTYAQPGVYMVKLDAIHSICPSLNRQVEKRITIVQPKPGIKTRWYATTGIPELLLTRDMGAAVQWDPGTYLSNAAAAAPVFTSNTDGTFRYKVEHRFQTGCITSDSVTVICGTDGIYVPGAFTPDNDGLNDIIRPIIFGKYELVIFRVFDRAGQVVFSTSKKGAGWDGRIQMVLQPGAVYVWLVQVKRSDGTLITKKGTFALIR